MEEKSSFVVRDRRSSLSSEEAPQEILEKKAAQGSFDQEASASKRDKEQPGDALPVNFSSFILSLATSALIHLGEELDPATGEKSIALPNARQVIDLITLLEEKTQGNLTKDEKTLLSQLLFTLRMKFVEAEKKR